MIGADSHNLAGDKFLDILANLYTWPNSSSPTTTVVGEFCVYENANPIDFGISTR